MTGAWEYQESFANRYAPSGTSITTVRTGPSAGAGTDAAAEVIPARELAATSKTIQNNVQRQAIMIHGVLKREGCSPIR